MRYDRAMIAHLSGTILLHAPPVVVLDVAGVGYRVTLPKETAIALLDTANTDKTVSLWTYLAVRETSLELFGFETEEELAFFELLISVSGIGPRSALAILNLETVATLRSAIAAGDTSYLTKVSGIGRKSAQKIVLELKDKIAEGGTAEAGVLATDALEALVALGYTQKEARDALKDVPKDVSDTNEQIREALKRLGTRST